MKTWPDGRGWRDAIFLASIWASVGLTIGLGTGLLRIEYTDASTGRLLTFAVVATVIPCLVEETVFRALLNPHRSEACSPGRRLAWASLSLLLFVAWHPFNGWLFKVSAWPVFVDPVFLTLAALLGITCTLAYYRTGSIWPCVAIHWCTLLAWKIWLGGRIIPVAS